MKEYIKPEIEVVNFASESITVELGDTYGDGYGSDGGL